MRGASPPSTRCSRRRRVPRGSCTSATTSPASAAAPTRYWRSWSDRRIGSFQPEPDGERKSDSTWLRSPCLGKCDRAPAAFVTCAGPEPREALIGDITLDRVRDLLAPGSEDPEAGESLTAAGNVIRQPASE